MIFVPEKRKCLPMSGAIDVPARLRARRLAFVTGVFDTGTDSPTGGSACYVYYIARKLTCEHALVNDAIASQQKAVARKLC
jgi:hypothetical protein